MDHSEHSFAEPSSQDCSVVDPFPSDLADATPEQLAAIHAILDLAAANTSANAESSTGADSTSITEDRQHAPLLPDPVQLAMPLSPSITALFSHQHPPPQQEGHVHNDQQPLVGHEYLLQSTSRLSQQATIHSSSPPDDHGDALPPSRRPLSNTGQLIISTTRPSATAASSSSAIGFAELEAQDGPSNSASLAHLQDLLLNSPLTPPLAFPANSFGYASYLDHEQTAAAVLAMATAMNQDVQQQHSRTQLANLPPASKYPIPSESSSNAPKPALSDNASPGVAQLHSQTGNLASPILQNAPSSSTRSTTASHIPGLPLVPLAPPEMPFFAAFPPRVPLAVDESRYRTTPLLDPLYATVEKIAANSNIPGFKHADRIAASETVAAHRDEMRLLCESVESACLNDPKLQELTAVGAYDAYNDDYDQPDTALFELMHKRFVLRPAAVHDFHDYMIQFQQHLSALVWDTTPLVLHALGIRTTAAREQLRKAQQLYIECATDMSRSFQEQYEARRDLVMRTQAVLPMFSCAHSRSWAPPFPHVRNLDAYFAHAWNQSECKLAATFILWLQEIKSQQKTEDMEPVSTSNDVQLKDVPPLSTAEPRSSRKRGDAFDSSILSALRASYTHDRYPNEHERERLARLCNLTVHQVSVWFSNRRQRDRVKEKKRRRRDQSPDMNESAAPSPAMSALLSPTSAPTASAALQRLLSTHSLLQPAWHEPKSAASSTTMPVVSLSSTQAFQVTSAPSATIPTSDAAAQAKRRASASAASPSVARLSQRRRAVSPEPNSSAPRPTSTPTTSAIVNEPSTAPPAFTYPLGPLIPPPQFTGFPFSFGLPVHPLASQVPPYPSSFTQLATSHGPIPSTQLPSDPLLYPSTITFSSTPLPAMDSPPALPQNQSLAPQPPPPPPQAQSEPTQAGPPSFYSPFQIVPQPHPIAALPSIGPMDQATAAFIQQQQQQYAYMLSMATLGPYGSDPAASVGTVPNPDLSSQLGAPHGATAQASNRNEEPSHSLRAENEGR